MDINTVKELDYDELVNNYQENSGGGFYQKVETTTNIFDNNDIHKQSLAYLNDYLLKFKGLRSLAITFNKRFNHFYFNRSQKDDYTLALIKSSEILFNQLSYIYIFQIYQELDRRKNKKSLWLGRFSIILGTLSILLGILFTYFPCRDQIKLIFEIVISLSPLN